MIDYYLHKKCQLVKKSNDNIRCGGCIWLDQELRRCIFAIDFPRSVSLAEFRNRLLSVNEEQQNGLTDPSRRFVP